MFHATFDDHVGQLQRCQNLSESGSCSVFQARGFTLPGYLPAPFCNPLKLHVSCLFVFSLPPFNLFFYES
jgi:hypothetical protein